MKPDVELDCTGLCCPMPIMKLNLAVKKMQSGQLLEIRADDRGILKDLPAWCASTGHQLVQTKEEGPLIRSWVRKVG